MNRVHKIGVVTLLLLALNACQRDNVVIIPTPLDISSAATMAFITQEAPPVGFDTVSFPSIDNNLSALSGWRYEMSFSFDGTFARTSRRTSATTSALVQFNQLLSARRVVTTIDNDLQNESDPVQLEAVRLGEDIFLLRDGVCDTANPQEAQAASELSAGAVLGGVQQATVAYKRGTLNGEAVWLYTFDSTAVTLPAIDLGTDGKITALSGELWVAPARNAVIRYYLNLDVDSVTLLGSTLPVTGTVLLRYDVYDIGVLPNISVPFGC